MSIFPIRGLRFRSGWRGGITDQPLSQVLVDDGAALQPREDGWSGKFISPGLAPGYGWDQVRVS
jgi:hypothetical protein